MLSTIGRNPTAVPVRGNISSAANEPWPVPNVNTSLPFPMLAAHTSAALSSESSWLSKTRASFSSSNRR